MGPDSGERSIIRGGKEIELQVTGRNIKLTEEVRSRVQRKIGKLGRYFGAVDSAKVEISREMTKSPEERYAVQVTIDKSGTLLRGEERAVDLYSAIDSVADVMSRQVESYKGKLYGKRRSGSPLKGESSTDLGAEPSGKVVRVKQFEVKPMPPEEAIDQMELLNHNFYVFLNSFSGRISVLYRRRDGDYGLIEPVPD